MILSTLLRISTHINTISTHNKEANGLSELFLQRILKYVGMNDDCRLYKWLRLDMFGFFILINRYYMQDPENKQLKNRLLRQATFKNDMDNVSKKYAQFQQQVFYSPIKNINPQMILKIETKENKDQPKKLSIFGKREDYYIINGQYQPQGDKGFEKLILQIVQTIPRPQKPFGMIYINTFTDGNAYNDFKKVLELLPFEFFFNLTKIYVVEPTFFNKASFWLSFGTITNYIKNKTINIDTIQQLSKHTRFEIDYLLKVMPKNVSMYFQSEIKAYNLRRQEEDRAKESEMKYLSGLNKEVKESPKTIHFQSGVFDAFMPQSLQRMKSDQPRGFQYHSHEQVTISKDSSQNTTKKKIQQYVRHIRYKQIGPTGAPIILQLLIYYFNSKQQALKMQGIFRKSVSIDDETQILEQLHMKNYNCIEKIENPHVIANAIKRFLANFRIPLISFELFNYFMTLEQNQKLHGIVVDKVKQLPKVNKMTLFILFDFLMNKVLKYADSSKMSLNNLCIVFGPCLMRSEVSSIKDLIYAKKIIVLTNVFFIEFQSIFGSPNEQNKMKRTSYKQFKKEDIMQKINVSPQKEEKKQVAQLHWDHKKEEEHGQLLNLGEIKLYNQTSQFIKESLEHNDQEDEELEEAIYNQGKTKISESKAYKTHDMTISIKPEQEEYQVEKKNISQHFKSQIQSENISQSKTPEKGKPPGETKQI